MTHAARKIQTSANARHADVPVYTSPPDISNNTFGATLPCAKSGKYILAESTGVGHDGGVR
jgi:hypothetical protein